MKTKNRPGILSRLTDEIDENDATIRRLTRIIQAPYYNDQVKALAISRRRHCYTRAVQLHDEFIAAGKKAPTKVKSTSGVAMPVESYA